MKRLIQASLAGLAILALAATGALAGSDRNHHSGKDWQYAIKYVCGTNNASQPIHSGDYRTAINVVNANDRDTVVIARAVPTNGNGNPVEPTKTEYLSFTGDEIDCPEIRALAGGGSGFLKGMVILQSCKRKIDVAAVYTSAPVDDGPVNTQIVDAVDAGEIDLHWGDCHLDNGEEEGEGGDN